MARVSDQIQKGPQRIESKKTPVLTNGDGAMAQIAAEERHRLIAETAYYRALQRRFEGENAMEDWLAAEAEIDRQLLSLSTVQPRTPADA